MIKRKIIWGFICIGSLLFLSGIISSGELIKLNRTTSDLLSRSKGNIELSKTMLDAVQEQNTALLMSITDSTSVSDSLLLDALIMFEHSLLETERSFSAMGVNSPELIAVKKSAAYYNNVVVTARDTINLEWFSHVYKTTYHNLTGAIKDFMVANENHIVDFATEIERNAYRSSMVGLISLAGGVMLIVLFYFMLNNFFIRPIEKIVRSLKGFVERGMPFKAEVTTKDEIRELKELIEALIEKSKR